MVCTFATRGMEPEPWQMQTGSNSWMLNFKNPLLNLSRRVPLPLPLPLPNLMSMI
jgi:hypothetical protein